MTIEIDQYNEKGFKEVLQSTFRLNNVDRVVIGIQTIDNISGSDVKKSNYRITYMYQDQKSDRKKHDWCYTSNAWNSNILKDYIDSYQLMMERNNKIDNIIK